MIGTCFEKKEDEVVRNKDVPQGKLLGLAEYSRHYSAKSEYLRRQNINSKSGEEQKKNHHVRRSPNFDSNLDTEQKKVKMKMLQYSAEYSDSTPHIPSKECFRIQC